MSSVPPVPYRSPLLGRDGRVTRNWQQWFQALLDRVGGVGNIATNEELQGETELSLGAQTSTHIAEILRRLDEIQTAPREVQEAVAEVLFSAPMPVFTPADSLGLAPRSESVVPDFTLGYGPGGF